jgi:hypothetical protein
MCGSITLPNRQRGTNRQIHGVIVDGEKRARARLIPLLERQTAVQVRAALMPHHL